MKKLLSNFVKPIEGALTAGSKASFSSNTRYAMYPRHTLSGKAFCGLIFLLCALTLPAAAQSSVATAPAVPVKWMTIEEALAKSKTEKKKIFIDVYTDWCGWCKVMDAKTFSDPTVATALNEQFYPVKFNAEQIQDVSFNGRTYHFIPQGRSGYHEFAAMLLNNQLGFPTVVFMNEDMTQSYPLPGYKDPKAFYSYMVFFKDDHYKKGENAWEQFQKEYKSPF